MIYVDLSLSPELFEGLYDQAIAMGMPPREYIPKVLAEAMPGPYVMERAPRARAAGRRYSLKLPPDLYMECRKQAKARGMPIAGYMRALLAEATPTADATPSRPTYAPPPERERKYLDWRKLKVGDHVFIARQGSGGNGAQSARKAGMKYGMKFSCKTDWRGAADREWGVYISRIA